MILAGDIGGTHSRLALYNVRGGNLDLVRQEVYLSQTFPNLREVVQTFMTDSAVKVKSACFGIAGPVVEDRVVASNLPWIVHRKNIQEILKMPSIWLINDVEAAANGIDELEESELFELNPGKSIQGNRAVLFAGTGLGEALTHWYAGKHLASPSEGGHSDFAPRDGFEMELCEFLGKKFGHVSWERVLSGNGIHNLYQFLQAKEFHEEPTWLSGELKGANPSIAIMRAAQTGENVNCRKARELFIQFFGRESGNLALSGLAIGGVYLGGGIARNIAEILKDSIFMKEFSDKGRMHGLLSNIPVRVILSDHVGLLGAARFAALKDREKRDRKAA